MVTMGTCTHTHTHTVSGLTEQHLHLRLSGAALSSKIDAWKKELYSVNMFLFWLAWVSGGGIKLKFYVIIGAMIFPLQENKFLSTNYKHYIKELKSVKT